MIPIDDQLGDDVDELVRAIARILVSQSERAAAEAPPADESYTESEPSTKEISDGNYSGLEGRFLQAGIVQPPPLSELMTFWRIAKAVTKAGRRLGLDGDATANDVVKVGTFNQQADKMNLYSELPAAVKRLSPDLVWQFVDSLVMTSKAVQR